MTSGSKGVLRTFSATKRWESLRVRPTHITTPTTFFARNPKDPVDIYSTSSLSCVRRCRATKFIMIKIVKVLSSDRLLQRFKVEASPQANNMAHIRQRVGHTENECDCCGDESTTVYVVANGGSVPLMTMAAVVVVAEVVVVVVDVNAGGELLLLATLAAAAVDSVTVSVGECVRACTCKRARVFV
ncbi:hypothetical protein QTP88_022839 [Uroleucon formosanum]